MVAKIILPAPAPMHIPDGFLSVGVSVVCWVLAVIGIAIALWQSRGSLGERRVPLMGVLAAFIFAAQMLNFTVAGGTSGHMIGGALAAILLGPWAGMLTMTTVVAIQALLFQDGGLLVMGANILNMAVLAPLVGYGVYRGITALVKHERWGLFAGGLLGAWASVIVAATACAVQLGFSGTYPMGIVMPAMAGIHVLIGIGEALITVGALAFVAGVRRDLLKPAGGPAKGLGWAAVGLALALAVVLLAPLASPHPDGLERVAEDLGFIGAAQDAPFEIIPDYVFPGISNETLATIVAGLVGTLLVAAIAALVARASRRSTASQ
ncbi:MAG: cobalamin biosynthesis protein CbiM [Anaerolineales bacterium]|nr:cobalamin biosynthesis protein CbiM [Anaerolineales bacterium]